MKRIVPLALIAGALITCAGVGTSQAAALSGLASSQVSATQGSTLITKARWWRHRRCWWRHHHRHCRYW